MSEITNIPNAQHIKELITHEDIKNILAEYKAYPSSENDEGSSPYSSKRGIASFCSKMFSGLGCSSRTNSQVF